MRSLIRWTPLLLRAPGEATGSVALESAIGGMRRLTGWIRLRSGLRQALFLEGTPTMLCAGRRTIWLGWAARWRRANYTTRQDYWSARA